MSYFCIPQRWTTRGLEQHPRRFRPLRKIKRQQPPTLPKRCSPPPGLQPCPSHPHPRHAFVQRSAEQFGKNHRCLQSLIFYCTDFFSRPSFQNWGIFHMFMQLWFFTWSKRDGETSRILSSEGIQSQAKSLPAATGIYCFSLFQVSTMLNFLNFIRFSSVFRKTPYCSV